MSAAAAFDSRTFLGINQEAYQQLHLTASLHLRRQVFFAVCDDSLLQRQLAYQLDADYGRKEALADANATIVTFWLDPQQPSPLRPILDWLKTHRLQGTDHGIPLFQILGVDQLTQQSPALQNQFLLSLSRLELLLTRADISVLLWLSRPWLHKLQRGVPSFWRMRSRLFEFAGEPTLPEAEDSGDRPWIRSLGSSQPQKAAQAAAQAPGTSAESYLGSLWSMLAEVDATTRSGAAANFPMPLIFTVPETEAQSLPPAADTAPTTDALEAADAALASPVPPDPTAVVSEALHQIFEQYPSIAALWQQIEILGQQQAGPLTLAQMRLGLGQLCRQQIEAGDGSLGLLDLAIAAYSQAVSDLAPDSPDRCDSLNDLGSFYWLRSQQETSAGAAASWLERSVEAYHQALQVPNAPLSTEAIVRIYSNLGTTLGLLATLTEPVHHLNRAIEAYRQALVIRPAATHPLEYASLQNSLGAMHWQLSQLEAAPTHLHQAIRAYTEALQYRSPEADASDFAMLQNNLGIAYWSLAQYEQPGFCLEQAIHGYQAALEFRTLASDPAGCGATHNNLGTAYWDLAQHCSLQPDRQLSFWQQSVTAYEASLTAAQQAQTAGIPLNFDRWATLHSAGVVHDHIAQRLPDSLASERAQHLQRALELYVQAVEGWQDNPDRLALLKNGLAHNLRSQFEILGLEGQHQALAQIPPALISEVMSQV